MGAALSATGLEKAYGSVRALVGVDLEVGEGELVGLLGPNGAGKSTLVKIACGLVTPTSGRAEVCGEPAGSQAAHRSLGYLAELFRFPDWCTGHELLELHQRLAESEGGAAERRSCSSSSGSPTPAGAASARCPRACSSGSGSPRR